HAPTLLFNGVLAPPAAHSAPPTSAPGPSDDLTGRLDVATPVGSGHSAGTFRVLPRITSFSPGSGPAGTGVTITGSGFTDVVAVKFHGVPAASLSVDSDHQITAQVPVTASSGRITVSTAGGTTASPTSFLVPH